MESDDNCLWYQIYFPLQIFFNGDKGRLCTLHARNARNALEEAL